MDNGDGARMALGMAVGGIAAVAITKIGLNPQSATLRWIVYCMVAGIVVNSQIGMRASRLAFAGSLSAVALVVAISWMLLLGRGAIASISGVPIDLESDPSRAMKILGGLFVISWMGVVIGGLARPATLDLIQRVVSFDLEQAKKLESLLKIVVSIAGIAALFLL